MFKIFFFIFIFVLVVNSQNIDLVTVKINNVILKKNLNSVQLCFDNGIANIGDSPFIVKSNVTLSLTDASQQSRLSSAYQLILDPNGGGMRELLIGQFEFHPEHLHWHLKGVAQYIVSLFIFNLKFFIKRYFKVHQMEILVN